MKCVILIDAGLPVGLIANTAAVLSLSLSRRVEDLVGPDIVDASGTAHRGITRLPVPTLSASPDALASIRRRVAEPSFLDVEVIGFSSLAQSCKTYDEYRGKLSAAKSDDLVYLGIGLYGKRSKINQLTGSLPLLR